MGKLERLTAIIQEAQIKLKKSPFYLRYYSKPTGLTLKDHYANFTQLCAIHEVFDELSLKNTYMKQLPRIVQQVYFQHYMIKRDFEYIDGFKIKNLKAEILPETKNYIEFLKSLHAQGKHKEFFAHYLLRVWTDLNDFEKQLYAVRSMYFKTLPKYEGGNYGVSYYYLPKYCKPNFDKWYESLDIKESEIEGHLNVATETMSTIYAKLEMERNKKPKPKPMCNSCCFFTTAVAVSTAAASAALVTARFLN